MSSFSAFIKQLFEGFVRSVSRRRTSHNALFFSKTKRGLVAAPTFKKDGDARWQAPLHDETNMQECLQSVFSNRNVWHQVGRKDVIIRRHSVIKLTQIITMSYCWTFSILFLGQTDDAGETKPGVRGEVIKYSSRILNSKFPPAFVVVKPSRELAV